MSTYRYGQPSYPNPCLVPGCSRARYSYGLCKGHRWRVEHYGDTFEDIPLGALLPKRESVGIPVRRGTRMTTGPFFCTCPTTRPDVTGVCVSCGYKSVARMTHRNAETAYVRYPRLRSQPIEPAS